MSLLDKLKSNSPDNKLSLEGNGFYPQRRTPSFGYENPNVNSPQNPLNPSLSALQNTYSVDSIPAKIRIVDFNKTQYKSYLPFESQLDELDVNAPKNLKAGKLGSVVSQIYKSRQGRRYKDLGPVEGRY